METITIPSPSAFLRKSPVDDTRSPPHPPSVRSSKNATRRPLASSGENTITAGVQNARISKPKQSKSRNGCITCKGKRLKCDESKPTCEQCRKRNVQCGGYSKAFKWRSFEEANFTGKSGSKPKKVSPPPPPPPPPSVIQNISAYAQSSPSNGSNSEPTPTPGAEWEFRKPLPSPNSFHDPYQAQHGATGAHIALSPHFPNHNSYVPQSPMQNIYLHQGYLDQFSPSTFSSTRTTSENISQPTPIPIPRNVPPFPTGSPTLLDILLPGTDMNSPPPPMEPRPPQSPLPYIPSGYTPPGDVNVRDEDEDDVEEIVRADDLGLSLDSRARSLSNNWSFRLSSASPSPSDSSDSSTSSAMDLWAQPRLRPNSQEMLLLQFDRHTCGILSIKDGPNENPWRTVVWPLAQDSKPLYHAIASMTAFHSSKALPELRVDGMRHMHKSLTKLANSLSDMKFDDQSTGNELEAALATTLVLAFSESWDQHTSTGIKHLKGAKYFVNQAVVKHQKALQMGRHDSQKSNRLKFLCNSFIYMHVLARLTSLEEEDFADLDNVLVAFGEPFDDMAEIDPLMGAASTLFPLIGRVAAIVTRVRASKENSFTLISDAMELRKKIEQWQPPALVNFEIPKDPTSEVQHSLQTAEAYRWATLLHLHQAVPEIPSETAAVLADRVLKYLATVPLSSRAIIVQIFPLLAASCEAITQEDRNWVRNRWAAMSARMSIGNVDKCFEVIKEVWERRDAFESDKADRFLRRHAARGLPVNGLFPSVSSRGIKRKASSGDSSSTDAFFHGVAGSDLASFGSGRGSFSKRRAMTDESGMPQSITIDDAGTAASMYLDHYPTAAMQPSQLPMQSPLSLPSLSRKRSNEKPLESVEPEYTVRGRLHWMGVMSDHKWEVLLG